MSHTKTAHCLFLAFVSITFASPSAVADIPTYDVVVYGGTSSGVVAAVQVARMGKSVVLIEPGRHLGGLSSGGLGATDIGNKGVIGGMARDFYRRIHAHYANDTAWKWQSRAAFGGGYRVDRDTMWTFEPHIAETIFRTMTQEVNVSVVLGERLRLKTAVQKKGTRIISIEMESGRTFQGRIFIDATYEGDLTATAGVAYTVGREANSTYGETLNGVQTANAVHHQFINPVDPFVRPGDSTSGLLPGIQSEPPSQDGSGDKGVQAYCFRMCQTDVADNRLPWPKPADYDESRYELLLRNFETADHRLPINMVSMPNRKTDTNNNFAVSTDNIGKNYAWADADYATRARIFDEHKSYQMGLMWTLANHRRVPETIRQTVSTWGLARDEFTDSDHWPHQLYIREARRMVSDYVMTQHHCQGLELVEDSVGMAAYTMDSHHVHRYVKNGRVWNEGDVQVGGFPPYPISYRSIVPKRGECDNLIVPVCLSASHIAYGSIRMEPVFMVLGQSSATAAGLAIDNDVAIQDVQYEQLGARLLSGGQILKWHPPPPRLPIDPKTLPGVVTDNKNASHVTLKGRWIKSTSATKYVGADYLHDGNDGKGDKQAEFTLHALDSGQYRIVFGFPPNANRATNVPVTITWPGQQEHVVVNQRPAGTPAERTYRWSLLTKATLQAGDECQILVETRGTDGYVVVDAVRLVSGQALP